MLVYQCFVAYTCMIPCMLYLPCVLDTLLMFLPHQVMHKKTDSNTLLTPKKTKGFETKYIQSSVLYTCIGKKKKYCYFLYHKMKVSTLGDLANQDTLEIYKGTVEQGLRGDYFSQCMLSGALDLPIRCWHGFMLESGRLGTENLTHFQWVHMTRLQG